MGYINQPVSKIPAAHSLAMDPPLTAIAATFVSSSSTTSSTITLLSLIPTIHIPIFPAPPLARFFTLCAGLWSTRK